MAVKFPHYEMRAKALAPKRVSDKPCDVWTKQEARFSITGTTLKGLSARMQAWASQNIENSLLCVFFDHV